MMSAEHDHEGPPNKRRKLEPDTVADAGYTPPSSAIEGEEIRFASLSRPISPPVSRRRRSRTPRPTPRVEADAHMTKQSPNGKEAAVAEEDEKEAADVRSPFQLTKIRDLGSHQNVDAVELGDILGDPLIKECWNFNFLFDLDFVMDHFDADVKDLVKVKIVHGFWKREDEGRINLVETAERYPNLALIQAWMPDPFGTHHSKMLIMFRHDDFAQVVIHTANMIPQDWGNMTQAVWRSPLLPLHPDGRIDSSALPIGSGRRFKKDLFQYLDAYGKRLNGLTEQLVNYDFSAIRAAFIGSAPSRQKPRFAKPLIQTSFGWLGLTEILSKVPVQQVQATTPPNVVVQVSSIATLGQNQAWLKNFQSVLSKTASNTQSSTVSNFFTKASSMAQKKPDPTLNIIFPTPSEIRTSLDGYNSGHSIHTKTQSPAQQKQLEYLRPLFCHWKYSLPYSPTIARREAHRGPAAPHIKTYIRFTDAARTTIDWAMVTSANMSKQAWGELENKNQEVWIQSWETGVVVWPGLYGEDNDTVMVPTFGRDMPQAEDRNGVTGEGEGAGEEQKGPGKTVVGFRMPYDLPLSPYAPEEVPWEASLPDNEPDWKGRVWKGYQPHN